MVVTSRKFHRPGNHGIAVAISRIHPVSRLRTSMAVALFGVILMCLGVATWFVHEKLPYPQWSAATVSTDDSLISRVETGNHRGTTSAQTSDPGLLLESAREFARHKEWVRAERAYHALLQASPRNREGVVGLSDVLYAQHKYEESAAVLNQLSMVSGYSGRVE